MEKIKSITVLCLLIFFSMSFTVTAQVTDCTANYEKALLLYNRGMADSVLAILKPCIDIKSAFNKLSKEACARIYRLAALSSIMTGNPGDAEKYARELLVYQPDYKNSQHEGDLQEFRLMLDRINPKPFIRAGITAGGNLPFLKLQKEYSNYELASMKSSLKGSLGYQFEISGEIFLMKNLSLEIGAGMNQVIFKYIVSGFNESKLYSENKYDQKITWIEVPVIARYYFNLGAIRPYLSTGLSGRLSLYTMESSDLYGRYWFTESEAKDKVLTTFLTDFENFGILAGGGVCYDLKNMSLRFDIKYNQNIKNSAVISDFDSVTGYDDIGPEQKFHYTDDINLMGMKALQVSVGVMYNIKYKIF
jgi:hypothetical protein